MDRLWLCSLDRRPVAGSSAHLLGAGGLQLLYVGTGAKRLDLLRDLDRPQAGAGCADRSLLLLLLYPHVVGLAFTQGTTWPRARLGASAGRSSSRDPLDRCVSILFCLAGGDKILQRIHRRVAKFCLHLPEHLYRRSIRGAERLSRKS